MGPNGSQEAPMAPKKALLAIDGGLIISGASYQLHDSSGLSGMDSGSLKDAPLQLDGAVTMESMFHEAHSIYSRSQTVGI